MELYRTPTVLLRHEQGQIGIRLLSLRLFISYHNYYVYSVNSYMSTNRRPHWARGLRRASRLLRLRVRIPPGA